MKSKKSKKWLVGLIIVVLIGVLIALILNARSNGENTSLNLSQKKWIEANKKEVINVSVANNIPVFSNEGEGVFFDYIEKLEKNTGLTFNLISYDATSDVIKNDIYFEVVKGDSVDKLKSTDMVLFKDYYVLVSKASEKISEPGYITNKKIGVLTDDLANVSFNIPSINAVTYVSYNKDEEIKSALTNDNVDYIVVPRMRYLSYIVSNSYHIVYNMTELKEAYVLRTNENADGNLKEIVRKNYIRYGNEFLEKEYNLALMNLFMSENDISEKARADFLSKRYVFGFLENEPYTKVINNKLIGLDSAFINSFSDLTGASITIKEYNSVNDLTRALNDGKVDIAPNYYNFSSLSGEYAKTISAYDEEYVVLVHKDKTDVVVNSVKSLKGKKVITTNSTLAKHLEKEGKASVAVYDKIDRLIRSINKDSIVVLDKSIYEMYKGNKLSNYRVIYNDKENLEYGYIIRKANENSVFEKLFTTYMETLNHKQVYNVAWKNYTGDSKEINHAYFYVIGVVVIAFIIWLFASKKIKVKKKSKREETIRYVDPLTSLKNRNYLNKNFKKWENNAIYPQAIIVINLNNLRHVNDVYGHEEGDKLIRLAANILIKNQVDQSDIIRTDGNEYLIYMVGYEKNKVVAYMRKLYKELEELPYGYGATLGYSMIEDDIKTIDDAINEAVLEIRATKEMKNQSK